MKTCYYELLGVARTATDSELKKAYRRRALESHPDKNPDDPHAQERFIALQQAYEVLSDPQERAWYDAHRDQILRETGGGGTSEGGLTTDDLMRYFSSGAYTGFDQHPQSFFNVYRSLFAQLFKEELAARDYHDRHDVDDEAVGELHPDWFRQSFGTPESTKEDVDRFYALWESFSTTKHFDDDQKWTLAHLRAAPDRRIRRLMEKENKKLVDQARREYTDTVRQLVMYVKKRDPRVKAFADAAAEDRRRRHEQHLENMRRAARERAVEAANYVEQDWAKADYSALNSDEWSSSGEEDVDEQDEVAEELDALDLQEIDEDEDLDLYCVACEVELESPSDLRAHEATKAHAKRVARLRREMVAEEAESPSRPATPHSQDGDDNKDEAVSESYACQPCGKSFDTAAQLEAHSKSKKHKQALRDAKKRPTTLETPPPQPSTTPFDDPSNGGEDDSDTLPAAPAVKPKAAKKKDKKKAAAANPGAPQSQRCNVCRAEFSSKTKLFAHIKETGHALAVQFSGSADEWDRISSARGGGGGKGKKRK